MAREVIEGGRAACADAGISLAGGHSIDAPEPILVWRLRCCEYGVCEENSAATAGCVFLTKPLGIGVLTTAEKKGCLRRNINT